MPEFVASHRMISLVYRGVWCGAACAVPLLIAKQKASTSKAGGAIFLKDAEKRTGVPVCLLRNPPRRWGAPVSRIWELRNAHIALAAGGRESWIPAARRGQVDSARRRENGMRSVRGRCSAFASQLVINEYGMTEVVLAAVRLRPHSIRRRIRHQVSGVQNRTRPWMRAVAVDPVKPSKAVAARRDSGCCDFF